MRFTQTWQKNNWAVNCAEERVEWSLGRIRVTAKFVLSEFDIEGIGMAKREHFPQLPAAAPHRNEFRRYPVTQFGITIQENGDIPRTKLGRRDSALTKQIGDFDL